MKFLVFGMALFAGAYASGQILKIDKNKLASDSSGYFTGMVDGSVSVNNRSSTLDRQNVFVGFRSNVDLVYLGEDAATLFLGGISYFKIGDGPIVSHGSGHIRHIFYRKNRVTPEAFIQIQYDDSRNMAGRELVGGGLRANLVKEETNHLSAGLGLFLEDEKWRNADTLVEKSLLKVNSYLSGTVGLTNKLTLNTIVYYQTGYDKVIDSYRHRFNGHLEIKNQVSTRVKLKYSVDLLIDNRPIIPLNPFVYETYFGLEYHFN